MLAVNETMIGFDTATAACTVALARGGSIVSWHRVVDRRHNDLLLGSIDELLGDARDIDYVAFGQGPGSFTGVRIAASVAQGIALARGIPVVPVSTLATVAAGALRRFAEVDSVVACLGARKGELYTCTYRRNHADDWTPIPVTAEQAMPIEAFLRQTFAAGTGLCGDATEVLADRAAAMDLIALDWRHPHAEDLLWLASDAVTRGAARDVALALPVYLEGSGSWQKIAGR